MERGPRETVLGAGMRPFLGGDGDLGFVYDPPGLMQELPSSQASGSRR